ncbi:hypothetical protein [Pseudomonas sp. microsymbiont 2]
MKALPLPSGWRLFAVLAALTLLMAASVLATPPVGADGLRGAIRATARSSFALFLLTFLASTLAALLPSAFSRQLIRERRYLGLAFAFSHTVHGGLIALYATRFPELFWAGRTALANLPGSVGYLFIALLTLTSFKAPMRLLGPRLWKGLHSTGTWVLAAVFCLSFYKRLPLGGGYPLAFALMFAAITLKLVAKQALRLRRATPSLSN